MYTISQASRLLKVGRKTLMRWDKEGKFPANREELLKIRYYDEKDVKNHALWFAIRRKHKAHLKELHDVRKEVDKFIRITPLSATENPKVFSYDEMKKAYDGLREWEKEDRKILAEYSELPRGFRPKLDPEY